MDKGEEEEEEKGEDEPPLSSCAASATGHLDLGTSLCIDPADPKVCVMAGKGQGKYGKRDRDEEDTKPAIKKPKLQQVVSLGHGWNLNTRHAEQLSALAALFTTRKVGFNTTDDKAEVPEDASSSHGLYMEIFDSGIKKMTRYFLWVSNRAKELKIKLELLAVLGASLDLEVKNPMVAFSQGFNDCDKWEGVKSLLFELFGRQDPSCDGVADFLYAFTRTGEKFHMRIYKIQTMTDLNADTNYDRSGG
ncbi:uncharacterized protein LOC133887126 isoform X2 [Phragmites australis]|uniref:uncharacterized protein LOC133887126 isoform X2 n=1 Tax=Phragmites australis TaxID=29695 RepID=UPI002D7848C1|nr:uncharacterized protein LOC133887126 isoform X2 [Phragmites australis]